MKKIYTQPYTVVMRIETGARLICASDDYFYTNDKNNLHVFDADMGQDGEWAD